MPARDERREDRGRLKWRATHLQSCQRKATPAELLSTGSVQRVDEPDGEQQRGRYHGASLLRVDTSAPPTTATVARESEDGDSYRVPAPAARAAQDLSSKGPQAGLSIRDRGDGEGREERAERKEHPEGERPPGEDVGEDEEQGEGMTLDERSHGVLQVRGTTASRPRSVSLHHALLRVLSAWMSRTVRSCKPRSRAQRAVRVA